MNPASTRAMRRIIEDICDDCCSDHRYCTAKELLRILHREDVRLMVQLKCIEKYKYELETTEGAEIGWDSAVMDWAQKDYAKAFDTAYNEASSVRAIYKEIKKIVGDD